MYYTFHRFKKISILRKLSNICHSTFTKSYAGQVWNLISALNSIYFHDCEGSHVIEGVNKSHLHFWVLFDLDGHIKAKYFHFSLQNIFGDDVARNVSTHFTFVKIFSYLFFEWNRCKSKKINFGRLSHNFWYSFSFLYS